MAPHSSTLAWKIPWTEEPRRWATILRVSKSGTQLKGLNTHTHKCLYLYLLCTFLELLEQQVSLSCLMAGQNLGMFTCSIVEAVILLWNQI